MDGNFGEQKKEVPAPPAAEISIRTMDSDVKSLNQAGGDIASLQTFKKEFAQEAQNPENKFEIAGYGGPEKATFSPMPGIAPKQVFEEPGQGGSSWLKMLVKTIAIIIVVALIGFLAYYIFSNFIFS